MLIEVEGLTFIYGEGLPWQKKALDNISLTVYKGDCYAVMGSIGSGKSTLVQHFNGLLFPVSGRVMVNGVEIRPGVDIRRLRREVGLVFQFPEHQLFGETVREDVSFGPTKLGLQKSEVEERVIESLLLVGLEPARFMDRNPIFLSGGEKRRVAIAGVLAMRPSIMVLDEPTVGLDSQGRVDILSSLMDYRRKNEATLIVVSHMMEEITTLCNRGIVLHEGSSLFEGSIAELLERPDIWCKTRLELPVFARLYYLLKECGLKLPKVPLTREEFVLGVRECSASRRLS